MIRSAAVLTVLTIFIGASARTAAAQPKTLRLDIAGRLVALPEPIRAGESIRICIDGGVAAHRQVFYRLEDEVRNPERLSPTTGTSLALCDDTAKQAGAAVTVGQHAIFNYTVLEPFTSPLNPTQADGLRTRRAAALAELSTAQSTLKTERALVATLVAEIGQLGGGAILESLNEIRARQNDLRTRRAAIQTQSDEVDRLTAELEGLQRRLDIHDASKSMFKVYRIGALIIGDSRKAVYYEIDHESMPQQPYRLTRRWMYPTLYKGDDLYAVVTNAHPINEPRHFALAFTSEAGKPPDPAPVRPSVDQSRLGGAGRNFVAEEELRNAQMDVILSFGRALKANEIIKTTISSYLPSVTSDKQTVATGDAASTKHETVTETTTVKLLDAVEYPQVRDRYHYNLTTGVLNSWLREPTFAKIKTVAGMPAQGERAAIPDEYEVRQTKGSSRPFPVFQFSFYWTPKDIQQPWNVADLIPVPSVGFSLTSAADNVFVGFQSEVRRNVHLLYGIHYGRVTRLGPKPVDENRVATAPNLTKEFHSNGYIGLSFNLNFIKDLFK